MPLTLPLLLLGVAHATSVELPAKQQKKLLKAWDCSKADGSFEFIASEQVSGFQVSAWQVTGCGDTFIQTMNERRGMWSLGTNDRDLRRRAAFDLTCDASMLTHTYIDAATRGVSGCEQQITYIRVGQTWVANASSSQLEAPTAIP